MSDIADKIRRQVEFYFSDVNIAKDVFLKSKMAEDPEGFISLDVLLTFNRLNSLSKDVKVIADALAGSEKLVMNSEGLSVRRKDALPESIQTDEQTVYVKPVPATASLEQLQQFFSEHGTVLAVWRRYFQGSNKDAPVESRTKPSVFVVFGSKEEAEKFVAAPPQFDGVQLSAQTKTAYLEEKAAQVAAKNKNRKRERDDDSGAASGAAATGAPRTPAMPTNSSYRIAGCGSIERYSDVKGLWPAEEQRGVRYVFMPTKEEALIIFQDAETAEKMVASVAARAATLQGTQPTVTKLNEEEEKALIESVEKEIAERAAQHGGGGRGGRGGRGGHRGGRGGSRGGH